MAAQSADADGSEFRRWATLRAALDEALLLHAAGVAESVVVALPKGKDVTGKDLRVDPRIEGVALAGSHTHAVMISRVLAARDDPICPLVLYAGTAHEGGALAARWGGARYLHRFVPERIVSMDTAASGGNASRAPISLSATARPSEPAAGTLRSRCRGN